MDEGAVTQDELEVLQRVAYNRLMTSLLWSPDTDDEFTPTEAKVFADLSLVCKNLSGTLLAITQVIKTKETPYRPSR